MKNDPKLNILSRPWAFNESFAATFFNTLGGVDLANLLAMDDDEVVEGDVKEPELQKVGNIAIVPISGVLLKYPSILQMIFGGTSSKETVGTLNKLASDESIDGVVLLIDSPGGSVDGIDELASAVRNLNASKPTVAYIESQGCSAAYWVASQASRIYSERTATVGSIGVYTVLYDTSEAFKAAGLKALVVKAGEYKAVGVSGVAIEQAQLKPIQEEIDGINTIFKQAIQAGRKLTDEQISTVANGAAWLGEKARDLKLVDAVTSFEEMLTQFGAVIAQKKDKDQMDENMLDYKGTNFSSAKAAVIAQKKDKDQMDENVNNEAVDKLAFVVNGKPFAEVEMVDAKKIETVAKTDDSVELVATDKAFEPVAAIDKYEEGMRDSQARLAALVGAFSDDKDFAVNEFLAGHDVAKAKANFASYQSKKTEDAMVGFVAAETDSTVIDPQEKASADWDKNVNGVREQYKGFKKEDYLAAVRFENRIKK